MWRYEHNGGDMEISDGGEWVKWEDVKKAYEELEQLRQDIKSAEIECGKFILIRNRLRRKLETLKNNARICALGLQHVNEHYNVRVPHDAAMAADSILEYATKEKTE